MTALLSGRWIDVASMKQETINEILDEMHYRLLKQYDSHPKWNDAKDVIEQLDLRDLLDAALQWIAAD
jgi:hypothetical protein